MNWGIELTPAAIKAFHKFPRDRQTQLKHAIDEMETLRAANEQKIFEIQRINGQLNKALEVI